VSGVKVGDCGGRGTGNPNEFARSWIVTVLTLLALNITRNMAGFQSLAGRPGVILGSGLPLGAGISMMPALTCCLHALADGN